jgi:hypothetical protein
LYANEVNEFKIAAINLSNERLVGERFQVQVSSELVLLENDLEKNEQSFLVPELLPNQETEIRFVVKALSKPSANAVVSVNYGQTVFSDLVATRFAIVPSPLRVTVSPEKNVLSVGEASAVLVSLVNDSNQSLYNIRSELLSTQKIDSLSEAFETAELLPGNAVENQRFEFWPRALASEKNDLVVKTVFSDSLGEHELENRVGIETSDTGNSVLLLLGAVIVIGLLYWFWARTTHKEPVKIHTGKTTEKEK